MTNRRSLQTHSERMSRAFQFIPGHVGGRVPSAQPVNRRRTIGSAAAGVTAPPTWLDFQYWNVSIGDVGFDVSYWFETAHSGHPGWLEDGDTAVIMASSHNVAMTAPSGWTTLASGVVDGDSGLYYLVATQPDVTLDATVVVGTPGLSPGWDDDPNGLGVTELIILGFTGVPAGYEVKISAVTETTSSTSHALVLPDSGWLTSWSNLHTTEAGTTGSPEHGLVIPGGLSGHYEYGTIDNTSDNRRAYGVFTHPGYALTATTVNSVQWGVPGTPLASAAVKYAMGFGPA